MDKYKNIKFTVYRVKTIVIDGDWSGDIEESDVIATDGLAAGLAAKELHVARLARDSDAPEEDQIDVESIDSLAISAHITPLAHDRLAAGRK